MICRLVSSNLARVGNTHSISDAASSASTKMMAQIRRISSVCSICISTYQSAARKPNTAMNKTVRMVPCLKLSLKACQKGRKMVGASFRSMRIPTVITPAAAAPAVMPGMENSRKTNPSFT